ncbi:hypothetical protein [Amycolatopsis regifaucium]|uniref:hypothetical protein n=1 Tax=Amycolatopsis regifaucium TaxID=546365 RepID=UPI0008F66189|nr:hypothetical protein [Amycolatopsis regifaucium]SFH50401.1 hypothetical protein SAMN04489731_104513 [Amycolatopsis regifaucium]
MATKIDANAIRGVADNIAKIMDEHKTAFESLKNHWPNAGKFPLAQWVERVVDDRRNAVVAHADHLTLTFETMSAKLKAIADKFEKTDGDNAAAIKSLLAALEGEISGKITTFDQKTENDQRNYSGEGTNSDGDGYNDNLTQAVPSATEQSNGERPNEPWNAYTNPDPTVNHNPKPDENGWVS